MHDSLSHLAGVAMAQIERAFGMGAFNRAPIDEFLERLADHRQSFKSGVRLDEGLAHALQQGPPHCASPGVKFERLVRTVGLVLTGTGVQSEEDRTFIRLVLNAWTTYAPESAA